MSVTFDDPNALLLAAEVAEHRRTTTGKLAVERHRGTGPRLIRDGRRVLYKAGDLAEWLAEHTVTPGSPAA
jgi:hypothetical protein